MNNYNDPRSRMIFQNNNIPSPSIFNANPYNQIPNPSNKIMPPQYPFAQPQLQFGYDPNMAYRQFNNQSNSPIFNNQMIPQETFSLPKINNNPFYIPNYNQQPIYSQTPVRQKINGDINLPKINPNYSGQEKPTHRIHSISLNERNLNNNIFNSPIPEFNKFKSEVYSNEQFQKKDMQKIK